MLITVVDTEEHSSLPDIMYFCFKQDLQAILAFSDEEAATYIQQFTNWQNSGTNILTGFDKHKSPKEKAIDLLTSIPTINKRDAE